MSGARVIVRRDGKALAVLEERDVMPWFHRHAAAYSMMYAIAHAGYEVYEPEPWPDEKARQYQATARNCISDSYHRSHCRNNTQVGRMSCGSCALEGYEPRGGWGDGYSVKESGPNYAGWARVYVESGRVIPRYWEPAFLAQLNSDNRAYADALARSIATFGVVFGEVA